MNLFVSFATNNLLWILWYRFVIAKPEVTHESLVSNIYKLRSFDVLGGGRVGGKFYIKYKWKTSDKNVQTDGITRRRVNTKRSL